MPKTALVVALALSAAVGLGGSMNARAAMPPNVETIWVYHSSFTPSMLQDASGVVVTLVNQDTVAHRIVLYRGTTPTGFDVTLAPGQWYTNPNPLTCTGSCYSANYTFRDANLSYTYNGSCYSFCAREYVYNNGT